MTINRLRLFAALWAAFAILCPEHFSLAQDADQQSEPAGAELEANFLTNTRQLTFAGRRAGEGYFSRDGQRMVFQSEREPGNPFFQIYLLDFDTGDIQRVSPGHGKTTCAWIHPDGNAVLFASTHEDTAAKQKQQAEITARETGKERRYAWDYDENFDLFQYDVKSGEYKNLTRTRGYDAEGSWSPDGRILFASNRRAYSAEMTDRERERFDIDPAYMIDLYIMGADGSNLRRLTDSPGYDGGPFFSPDGKRICWRRFSTDGATAEVMTMNVDGTDQRQLTSLGAMSWAPYFHPSGDYLIFTTNRHGFANFELYIIDAEGKSEPVRVTYTDGFDGLPVFTPSGQQLAWTTNRTSSKQSQIFLASWNDKAARQALGLSDRTVAATPAEAATESADAAARQSAAETHADFSPQDILRHVDYLCRPELEGRRTGTEGGRLATAYVAAYLESLGLTPAGDDGGWFQEFEFTAGVDLGERNKLTWNETEFELNRQWRPLAFSATGEFAPANIVFGGYGLSVPEKDGEAGYDSFVHLDVADKWLLVFRFLPEDITPERRQQLSAHSSLRYKAMVARDKGARGLILVSGPNSQVRQPLAKLGFDGALSGSSIPVISVTDDVAAAWLATAGKDLKTLQDELDTGTPAIGFALPAAVISAQIDIRTIQQRGRNVLGRLAVGDQPAAEQIVVGAHVDHLGRGDSSSSLARDDEANQIHFGADDNASGVAAMLEIAQYLAARKSAGRFSPKRDILFAAWSGEEVGLLGSAHFAKRLAMTAHANPHPHAQTAEDEQHKSDDGGHHAPGTLYPQIAACLNMDMVGRLDKRLILQGIGSSSLWKSEIERRNAVVGLPVHLQRDSYLPTDASTFFMRGVPILSAFTGSHSEYHTPRDTPDKLNYEGAARTARLMALVARSLTTRDDPPDFVPQAGPAEPRRARLRAYLGTIPDYAETDVKGVMLSGVSKDGPAAKAGVRAGDVVIELAGRKIENIYDYTYAIEALKIGEEVRIVVKRGKEEKQLKVVPGSRQ